MGTLPLNKRRQKTLERTNSDLAILSHQKHRRCSHSGQAFHGRIFKIQGEELPDYIMTHAEFNLGGKSSSSGREELGFLALPSRLHYSVEKIQSGIMTGISYLL